MSAITPHYRNVQQLPQGQLVYIVEASRHDRRRDADAFVDDRIRGAAWLRHAGGGRT
jgi:hypothetical protein